MESTLSRILLSNQNLVLSYIKDKLDTVNFIFWGVEDEIPVLSTNGFVQFTSHIYYRSLIADICALYDNHKHQGSNFHLLVDSSKKYIKDFSEPTVRLIQGKLIESKTFFYQAILDLRNEEISHYRFRKEISFSMDLEYLPEINALYKIGLEILDIASQGFTNESKSGQYRTGLSDLGINGLRKIVKDITGIDYYPIWKKLS